MPAGTSLSKRRFKAIAISRLLGYLCISKPLWYTVAMTKLLEEAMAEVALLPESDQERIGRDVISYVEKLRHLRVELDKGISSLERGEGTELDIGEFIRRAHQRHGRA
jgi:hypothetical protein